MSMKECSIFSMMNDYKENSMPFDFKKAYKQYYQPKDQPEIIHVQKANYIAMRGQGDPNAENGSYQQAISILYAIAYTLRMSYKTDYKIEGFYEYVVPPLEGLWWQTGIHGVDYTDKSTFQWIAMIRLPDFITNEHFHWAIHTASKKKKIDCSKAEFFTIDEGLCVQILHKGTYDDEPYSVAKMDAYLDEQGYQNDFSEGRYHHEIYLSDPRKTRTDQLKTILRHPIKKRS